MTQACTQLIDVDLTAEFKLPIFPLQNVPNAIRSDFKRIQGYVFNHLVHVYQEEGNESDKIQAWKLFCLLSRLLLHRLQRGGRSGNNELKQRISKFDRGEW